jgi:CheY-like chemotaxis protein
VKDALEHLYDFPHLQSHPLALQGEPGQERPGETPSQRLRRELIAAIETLNPGEDVPFRAPHARLYNLLHLHHVEGMTIQEAAHELGISVRQAYRDLRRGTEGVAAVLWSRRSPSLAQAASRATELSSVQAEIDRLKAHPRPIDVRPLLQRAHKAVEQLAAQRAVRFDAQLSPEPVTVVTDPIMAQQVLISALSHALQQARPGALKATVESPSAETDRVSVTLRYDAEPRAADAPVISPVVAQLVDRLGWAVGQEAQPEGARAVVFYLPAHGPTVLVIDDNAGLVQLLDRYLTDQACRVVAAASGQEGLDLAQELLPDAIVLDVMMPEMDGWELLQRLRTHSQTAQIPAIICSVFNDPELAYSLGASLFLPKPVSRADVLGALRKLGVV